jgi:catechol-2,3-dioxygenase
MSDIRVNGLRGVELSVFDLKETADFYAQAWGLSQVASANGTMYMRGAGAEHHLLTLHEGKRAGLAAVHFSAPNRAAVDGLHAKCVAMGCEIVAKPHDMPAIAGGGYGFSVKAPEGQTLTITCDVARHELFGDFRDQSRPQKLAHVVLNSSDIETQERFFCDALGFKLSDCTARMDFIRCSSYHHSVALARSHGPSLNHMAYEVPNFDGLMRGAGRMKKHGFKVGWGVGRHGPGNNVFSYFIEPNGFVTEYTTEIEHVDETTHIVRRAEDWAKVMNGPDQWGLATPSPEMIHAMSGRTIEDRNASCEEIISRELAS